MYMTYNIYVSGSHSIPGRGELFYVIMKEWIYILLSVLFYLFTSDIYRSIVKSSPKRWF